MSIKRPIQEIILHCSATRHGVTAKQIKRYHVNDRGWDDCGYHFIIDSKGTINPMRNINRRGAHCKGRNDKSVGICYVGGRDNKGKMHRITPKQRKALEDTINGLFLELGKIIPVYGHNDYNPLKECPCLDVTELKLWDSQELRNALQSTSMGNVDPTPYIPKNVP